MSDTLTLTPVEWEIIRHRLTLNDALTDSLTCDNDDRDWETVYAIIGALEARCRSGAPIDVSTLHDIEREALIDCVDGSTWFVSTEDAVASGDISRGRLLGELRLAKSIELKFAAVGLATSGFPLA